MGYLVPHDGDTGVHLYNDDNEAVLTVYPVGDGLQHVLTSSTVETLAAGKTMLGALEAADKWFGDHLDCANASNASIEAEPIRQKIRAALAEARGEAAPTPSLQNGSGPMVFTVFLYHECSRQTAAHHIEADDGQEALLKAAKEYGGELVVAIAGKCQEAMSATEEGVVGMLTFPGDGLVDSQSYIETMEEG